MPNPASTSTKMAIVAISTTLDMYFLFMLSPRLEEISSIGAAHGPTFLLKHKFLMMNEGRGGPSADLLWIFLLNTRIFSPPPLGFRFLHKTEHFDSFQSPQIEKNCFLSKGNCPMWGALSVQVIIGF